MVDKINSSLYLNREILPWMPRMPQVFFFFSLRLRAATRDSRLATRNSLFCRSKREKTSGIQLSNVIERQTKQISHSLSNPEPFQMPHCLFILSLAPLFAWFKYQRPFNRLSFFIISPMRNPQLFQVIKVEAVFCNGERFGFKSPPFLINYSSFSNLCLP